jgi:hypothetical protein
MSWLEKLSRPKKPEPRDQSTTIIFHLNDDNEPIVHNLQGLWFAEALRGVLVPLVQEYYEPGVFQEECEILWQDGTRCWSQEVGLIIDLPGC